MIIETRKGTGGTTSRFPFFWPALGRTLHACKVTANRVAFSVVSWWRWLIGSVHRGSSSDPPRARANARARAGTRCEGHTWESSPGGLDEIRRLQPPFIGAGL
jgi:hypothetical protein